MIVFWICIILVIVFVFKKRLNEVHQPETALDKSKKRYAAGEISKEEFAQMKNNILSQSAVSMATSSRRICLDD